jgi:hypothetical protein
VGAADLALWLWPWGETCCRCTFLSRNGALLAVHASDGIANGTAGCDGDCAGYATQDLTPGKFLGTWFVHEIASCYY